MNNQMFIENAPGIQTAAQKVSFHTKLARFVFVIFLIVSFFGTSPPFEDETEDVDEIATSNVLNQVVYSALFLGAAFALMNRWSRFWALIKKEKVMLLFFLWCALSIVWSDFGIVTAKRLFRLLTVSISVIAFLVHTERSDEMIKYFKMILYIYVTVSMISVLVVPGAIDPKHGTWRALEYTKNNLGQSMVVNIIFWLNASFLASRREKKYTILMLIFSLTLLFGGRSMTSMLAFFALTSIGLVLLLDDRLKALDIGRAFSTLIIVAIFGSIFITLSMVPNFLDFLADLIGKDLTFTGRTDLWAVVLDEVAKHPFTGTGYQAFWVVENRDVLHLYEEFVWLPNQSHNGYVDLLNETGIIGISLVAIMFINYFFNLKKTSRKQLWKWFIVAALITNFQESGLFRAGHLVGTIFILAYMALFYDIVNEHKLYDKGDVIRRKLLSG